MLYFFDKKRKTERYFQAAHALKKKAADTLTSEQSSVKLYVEAYEIYRGIAENFFLKNEIRGQAAYHMYLLAKENNVTLSPIKEHEMMLRTPQQRCEGLLIWSASFGYQNPKLPNTTRPAFSTSESSHFEIVNTRNHFSITPRSPCC